MPKKILRAVFKLKDYILHLSSIGNSDEVVYDVYKNEELQEGPPYYFNVGDEMKMEVNYNDEVDQLVRWERREWEKKPGEDYKWFIPNYTPLIPPPTELSFIGQARDEWFRTVFNSLMGDIIDPTLQPPEILGEIDIWQSQPPFIGKLEEGSYTTVTIEAKGYSPLKSIKLEFKPGLPGVIPLPDEPGWEQFGNVQYPGEGITYANVFFFKILLNGAYFFKATVTDENGLVYVRVHPNIVTVTMYDDGYYFEIDEIM